jgi:ACS family tartrate transporter-like MFS transporter
MEPAQELSMRTRRRVAVRLMPYLFLLYIIAFLDRVNVSYAALQMTHDLGFSDRVFGFGAGIFFVGYFLLEIPGTLIVERWSARKWIARIMISWGILAAATGFIKSAHHFYWIRFALGMAEAGFFPGIIVYLAHWFRYEDRAKAVAIFMSALPLSNIIGSPFSGLILGVKWFGIAGWRWVFILEGLPAVIFGVVTIFYLTDWPRQARWLRDDERQWLISELEQEKRHRKAVRSYSVLEAFRQRDVVLLLSVYFCTVTGYYGFTLWMPTVLQRLSGLPDLGVTMVAIIPYLCGLVAMLLLGWHSDKTGERRWHTAIPPGVAGIGLLLGIAAGDSVVIVVMMFCIVAAAAHAYLPSFWAIPTAFLTESAAAAAIGLINSVGNLGGFLGPFLVGYVRTATGSFVGGMAFLSAALILASFLAAQIKPPVKRMTNDE